MKLRTVKERFAPRVANAKKLGLGGALALASAVAMAETGTDISAIGTSAAVEIAKFAVMISAIGAAVLSVVVLIQGFRMAFGMVKTAR